MRPGRQGEDPNVLLAIHDLGPHLLKDFDRPVRIYQLAVAGLEREFPALRTAGG